MFRKVIVTLMLLSLVVMVAAAAAFWWLNEQLDEPLAFNGEYRHLVVERGTGLSTLTRELADRELIESPLPLLVIGRLTEARILAGEYRISRGETSRELLQRLVRGDVVQYRITFPEGRTLAQWLEIIAAHPKLAEPGEVDLDALRQQLGFAADAPLEGWFYPDTYSFTATDDPETILVRAHRKMENVLEEAWAGRDAGLPLQTPYEALILASIVERETGVPEERSAIAGVFVRRLEKGMRLQTDPTIIYGLGDRYQGVLRRKHLREDTAYNTYRIDGLPPTAIGNPGRAAIYATLHPKPGDSLYFVARGDGSHYFSSTLEEHQQAVRRYQLNRGPDYRSTPQ